MSHTDNIALEQQETILILDFGSQYTQLIAPPYPRTERLLRNSSVHPTALGD